MKKWLLLFSLVFMANTILAQSFYFGADLSYVNELEDCGAVYTEDQVAKDPYVLFADHGCNLVRLRLWHSPVWYDDLNNGQRYSDLADVKKSISRAKQEQLQVLLDFHLTDNWADPSNQLVPQAWLPIVADTPTLKDSLYNYIFSTLSELNNEGLLPELIQIGNETNKGILLSPEDNATWTLDWDRNATLFNAAIQAVQDFEQLTQNDLKIVLHIAGPDDAAWLMEGFVNSGVTDFDIIGLSYYWAWHLPTSIEATAQIIQSLKQLYPDKEVMIVETGYLWTTDWQDDAANIIGETHPDYQPVSPIQQKQWLIDLTQAVIDANGTGVLYWEPAWVSTSCFTQWGQGSHQEHATFFDFDHQLLIPGGIEWMSHDYGLTTSTFAPTPEPAIQIFPQGFTGVVKIALSEHWPAVMEYAVVHPAGQIMQTGQLSTSETDVQLMGIPAGLYFVSVYAKGQILQTQKVIYHPW
ncbi:MAG: glycosyl hydrolase 53 family protein [Bacteroidota bacterium]